MDITTGKIASGCAGLVVGFLLVFALHSTPASEATVIDVMYPLFDTGISWTGKVSVSLPPLSNYNPTKSTIVGYQVTSLPTPSTMDVGAVIGPLRDYYDHLLLQKGWTMDTKFEADGAGGSLWGFTKGSDILILSYTSTFMDQEVGRLAQCPCTIIFTIIGGSLK